MNTPTGVIFFRNQDGSLSRLDNDPEWVELINQRTSAYHHALVKCGSGYFPLPLLFGEVVEGDTSMPPRKWINRKRNAVAAVGVDIRRCTPPAVELHNFLATL